MRSSLLDLPHANPRHLVAGLLGQLRALDPDAQATVLADPLARLVVVGQEGVKRLVRHLVFQHVLGAVLLGEGVAHLVHAATGVDLLPVHFAIPSRGSFTGAYSSRPGDIGVAQTGFNARDPWLFGSPVMARSSSTGPATSKLCGMLNANFREDPYFCVAG